MNKMLNPKDRKFSEMGNISSDPAGTAWLAKPIIASAKNHRVLIHVLPWTIFVLVSLFNLYEYLLRVLPSVIALPVMASYQINATAFGHLSAYFYFIYAPMQIWVGILMDRFGPHHLLPLAALTCALGTFLFSSSSTLFIAQIGRFLMGLGSSFAFVGGLKLLVIYFAPRRFGFLTGVMVSFCLLGGILGQVFIALLLKVCDWRLVCSGIALMGLALFFLMWSFMRRGHQAVNLPTIKWHLIFSGIRFLLKNPQVWLLGIVGCLFYLPTSVFAELWGISYLKVGYGFSNTQAAYMISIIFLGWAIGCPLMGWISDYLHKPRLLMVLGAFCSLILLLAILILPHMLKAYLQWLMFALGFLGSTQILAICIIRQYVPLKIASTAISFLNMFVLMGGFLFQPLIGFLLDKFWQGERLGALRYYSADNYQIVLMVLPLALLLGIFLSLFFSNKTNQKWINRSY